MLQSKNEISSLSESNDSVDGISDPPHDQTIDYKVGQKRKAPVPSAILRDLPFTTAEEDLQAEFEQMLQEDTFVFINHFLTVASSYNHIDLKDSIKCPYKYRAHFEAMLLSELEQ